MVRRQHHRDGPSGKIVEAVITRLVGAVLLEADDDWQLQQRTMQVEGMAELGAPQLEEGTTLQITPAPA